MDNVKLLLYVHVSFELLICEGSPHCGPVVSVGSYLHFVCNNFAGNKLNMAKVTRKGNLCKLPSKNSQCWILFSATGPFTRGSRLWAVFSIVGCLLLMNCRTRMR
ncbi:hypothetical protein ATANTOWER_022166 [Ataeniobius toweri]|uniref:Secreted protein n=1 Tax=Ataeniobius toweri TaxID=208326 RepID=A0ABU7B7Z8_9TELE|nr:hypothetical protein [Ataeniobius toweri]